MKILSIIALLFASLLAPGPAHASSEYPTRVVRLLVPFPPGGPVDVVARVVAQKLGDHLGRNVIVENRPGGGALLGVQAALNAQPDGYTLLLGSTASISLLPLTNINAKFNPDVDFATIAVVAEASHLMLVNGRLPPSDLSEFVAFAKSQDKPVTAALGGRATPVALAGDRFKRALGLDFLSVPYAGTGPANTDVAAGHVQFTVADISSARPFLDNKSMKAIGIAALKRSPLLPEIPTLDEQGLKGFESSGWFGIFAPAKVPPEILEKLGTALASVSKDPETQARFSALGLGAVTLTGAGALERVAQENARYRGLTKELGIVPQ